MQQQSTLSTAIQFCNNIPGGKPFSIEKSKLNITNADVPSQIETIITSPITSSPIKKRSRSKSRSPPTKRTVIYSNPQQISRFSFEVKEVMKYSSYNCGDGKTPYECRYMENTFRSLKEAHYFLFHHKLGFYPNFIYEGSKIGIDSSIPGMFYLPDWVNLQDGIMIEIKSNKDFLNDEHYVAKLKFCSLITRGTVIILIGDITRQKYWETVVFSEGEEKKAQVFIHMNEFHVPQWTISVSHIYNNRLYVLGDKDIYVDPRIEEAALFVRNFQFNTTYSSKDQDPEWNRNKNKNNEKYNDLNPLYNRSCPRYTNEIERYEALVHAAKTFRYKEDEQQNNNDFIMMNDDDTDTISSTSSSLLDDFEECNLRSPIENYFKNELHITIGKNRMESLYYVGEHALTMSRDEIESSNGEWLFSRFDEINGFFKESFFDRIMTHLKNIVDLTRAIVQKKEKRNISGDGEKTITNKYIDLLNRYRRTKKRIHQRTPEVSIMITRNSPRRRR